ncbi:Rieske (2Fe-2S) protein [Olivibacter sp. SDN3]|uniref:QcrA and Rieske domain-containing protein n=1 Tax=Olivibacter sp. SDN3 TaxID=2764720 RepID=UPI001651A13F|nr:Rieske (2Fe-2S) protein [Olivibacter sp. SDN3]QNL47993.1 Rieske (2Fe-2S) protein [Olivibacter sp. SDN3]
MSAREANDNLEKIPNWKSDFPIESDNATHVGRREFAKFLALFSGALALTNGVIVVRSLLFPTKPLVGEHFVCNETEVPIGKMFQFEIKGSKVIPYILIHLAENEWRAFEQKCTHLTCAVRYREDLQKIECPCHHGFFSADTGEVLQGPPPRRLPQLEVVAKEGKIYVKQREQVNG